MKWALIGLDGVGIGLHTEASMSDEAPFFLMANTNGSASVLEYLLNQEVIHGAQAH